MQSKPVAKPTKEKNRACMAKAGILFFLSGADGTYPDETLLKQGLKDAAQGLEWDQAEFPPVESVQGFKRTMFIPLTINGESSLFKDLSECNEYIKQKLPKAQSLEKIASYFCSRQTKKRFRPHVESAQAAIFYIGTIPSGNIFPVKD